MAIKKGDKVKVHYTGTLDDGTVFDSSDGREPLEFEVGSDQLIKGFDEGVLGMEVGDEKNVHIKAIDAYGDQNPNLVKKIPRAALPKDKEPEVGMMLGIKTPNGDFPAQIVNVDAKEVTVDLNHPLAGKALTFKIKIVEVA